MCYCSGMTVKNLVSKADLSTRAGVSRAAVTKACKGALLPAVSGNKIDLDHPLVSQYLKKREKAKTKASKKPEIPGLDPLYKDAVKYVASSRDGSVLGVGKHLGVTAARAVKICNQLEQNAVISKVQGKGRVRQPIVPSPSEEESQNIDIGQEGGPQHFKHGDHIGKVMDLTVRQIIAQFGNVSEFHEFLKMRKLQVEVDIKEVRLDETRGELIRRDYVKESIFAVLDGINKKVLTEATTTIPKRLQPLFRSKKGTLEEGQEIAGKILNSYYKNFKDTVIKALRPNVKRDTRLH